MLDGTNTSVYDLVDIIPEVVGRRWRIGRRTVSSHGSRYRHR